MKENNVRQHFDSIAYEYDKYKKRHSYYYKQIKFSLSKRVPEKSIILEVGCGTGDILAFLKPRKGKGIDISKEMIIIARKKHPNLKFEVSDAENIKDSEIYDVILLVDIIEHLYNIPRAIESISKVTHQDSKILIWYVNPWMSWVTEIAEKLNLKMPEGDHNWVKLSKLKEILKENGFSARIEFGLILPINIPPISDFLNSIFYKIPLLNKFCYSILLDCRRLNQNNVR